MHKMKREKSQSNDIMLKLNRNKFAYSLGKLKINGIDRTFVFMHHSKFFVFEILNFFVFWSIFYCFMIQDGSVINLTSTLRDCLFICAKQFDDKILCITCSKCKFESKREKKYLTMVYT